jgi:hypothetical protein
MSLPGKIDLDCCAGFRGRYAQTMTPETASPGLIPLHGGQAWEFTKTSFTLCVAGIFLNLSFLCSGAPEPPARRALPADVPINKDAGRGNWLFVTIQLESGQKLPVIVDTGAGGTGLDKSLAPKLGKRLGSGVLNYWGKAITNDVYTAPKLFLGGTPLLMTGDGIVCSDVKSLLGGTDRKFMGILGMDVLEHYCIQLDFAAGKMRFLDDQHADKSTWGKAFPIVQLSNDDARAAVAQNLLGLQGPPSIIDSGFLGDGWLTPKNFQSWTNDAVSPTNGELHWPYGRFGGEKYPMFSLGAKNVESDGIGIDFLARHLVTLDFPNHTLYLQRQSIGPRPGPKMAEYKPIPDREPNVTAHLRAVLQARMDGTAQTDDYTASAWKRVLSKQKDIQAFKKYVGDIVSLTLVERSSVFGWRRSYRYRIEFTRATVLAHFVLHGHDKLASGEIRTLEWKEPLD